MDEVLRGILEARARRYAAPPLAPDNGADVGTYAGCRIGPTVLGIPVSLVHEFAPLRHWTPLRGRPGLLGVTHLRGDVMALVDLLDLLAARPSGECEWMVVVQGRGGRSAAPVSEVVGIRRVGSADLLPPEQAPSLGRGVSGVTTDLWFLVDPAALAAALDDTAPAAREGPAAPAPEKEPPGPGTPAPSAPPAPPPATPPAAPTPAPAPAPPRDPAARLDSLRPNRKPRRRSG